MVFITTFVTNPIWTCRLLLSRDNTIYTNLDLELNLLQRFSDQFINCQSVRLQEERLVLILLLHGNRFPIILINKVAVFTHIILYKVIICDQLLWLYEIHVTHMNLIDKFYNLLVLLNLPKTEYVIIIIFKGARDIS